MLKRLLYPIFSFVLLLSVTMTNAQSIVGRFKVGGVYTRAVSLITAENKEPASGQKNKIQATSNFGLNIGYNIAKNTSVEVELLIAKLQQHYQGRVNSKDVLNLVKSVPVNNKVLDFDAYIELQSFDVPVLLRLGKIVYCEIGAQFSVLTNAKYSNKLENLELELSDLFEENVKEQFNSTFWMGLVGTGVKVNLFDTVELNGGIRVGHTLNKIDGINAVRKEDNNHALMFGGRLGLNIIL